MPTDTKTNGVLEDTKNLAKDAETELKKGADQPATETDSEDQVFPVVDDPMFLMNVPYTFTAAKANNVWMEELEGEKRSVDVDKAMTQFLDLYHFIAGDAVVYLLPAPENCGLQDLVFTANLGCVLEHVEDREVVILSNMATEPRMGETVWGRKFFEGIGFEVFDAPHRFEGEAELKHLKDNIYIGGYGERTDVRVFDWMEDTFDMKIIRMEEVDPYCYHLDCSVFPVTTDNTMVATSLFKRHELEKLSQFTNIIDVSADSAYSGICNSVRLHSTILNSSNLHQLKIGTEEYQCELEKNRELEDVAAKLGFEVAYFNLSEYMKGGALLSCMIMHLNRHSNEFSLI